MERTVLRWKNVSGSLRIGNRIIKPGQIFTATEEEVPHAFRDTVLALDPLPAERVPEPTPLAYSLKKKNGLWNVVDGQGKVLNEEPLPKEQAEELLKTLA